MKYFIIAFILSLGLTLVIIWLASYFNIVDRPDGGRKLHQKPLPLLGGLAIFISFWTVVGYLLINPIRGVEILAPKLIAALVGGTLLMLIGIVDDIKPFSSKWRITGDVVAIIVSILLGLGLSRINNPFGGTIELSLIVGNVVVFFWLLGMTYTTKILDGLDGLSTGIAAIGALIIFLFTMSSKFYQPNVALISLIFAGACLGFLVLNFYPAKIFLGEGGSLFLGFMLATLAIISGSKLAIASLVMAVPIIDLVRVVYVRLKTGKSFIHGDREHLHFKLLTLGFGHRASVLLLYGTAAALGLTTLFLQSAQKIILLGLVFIVMFVLFIAIDKKPAV